METLAIDARGIAKRFGDVVALNDVDFSARYGEVTGLLGPNGAGKTTLIRILTTVVSASAGSFTVAGHGPDDSRSIRASVGVLPESGGLPRRKRAVDHLAYHARLYGIDPVEAETRTMQLLDQVGLGERAADRIGTFSRGMRQRLGIARALLNEPDVVFLDEPTLGLDPSGQRQILELIGRLAAQSNAAVVLSSHLLDEVERVADRTVILDKGRVVLDRGRRHVSPSAARDRTSRLGVRIRVVGDPLEAATVLRQRGFESATSAEGDIEVMTEKRDAGGQILSALLEAGLEVERFRVGLPGLAEQFLEVTGP